MNKNEKKYVLMLLLVALLLYTIWAIVIPFDKAPDEFQRFDVVDFIFKYRHLPITGDERLIYGSYGITYATTPYLPYMISALICIASYSIGINIEPYLLARILSVLSGVGTVYFCYLISNKIFTKSKMKHFFPFFIMLIPQFSFICGYVNQDSFTVFLTSIMIYLWINGICSNWEYKVVIQIGIVSGIVLLSYLNGYTIILSTLLIVLLTYKGKNSKDFYKKILLCITVMFLVSGWFFIRNYYINEGDFLGLEYSRKIAEKLALPSFKPSVRKLLGKQGLGFSYLVFNTDWVQTSFKSFWGVFDYMTISIYPEYYMLMLILCILGIGGIIYKVKIELSNNIKNFFKYPFYIALVFSSVFAVILHAYYSLYCDYQPQGRYMFGGLVPMIILLCKGLDELLPNKIKPIVYKILTLVFFYVNILAVGKDLYIHYYMR